jgi:hypothetical protein
MAQTVELYFPTSQRLYFGMEAPPKCPHGIVVGYQGVLSVAYTLPDDSLIMWSDKVIDQYFPDGRRKTWWAKPTVADAVNAESHGIGFHFHRDGTVEASYPQGNYYWSATIEPWDLPEGSVPATEFTTPDGHYYAVGDRKIYTNYDDCPYPCCGGDGCCDSDDDDDLDSSYYTDDDE